MLLIYTQKLTPRIDYIFKHVCVGMLGIEISFTSEIEAFISHNHPKISYGKVPLGSELYFEASDLLLENKIKAQEIDVMKWGYTYGFFPSSEKSALAYDIFAASFYLITRYEEYLPDNLDASGDFSVKQSLAFKNGFLMEPLIDIWADIFLNILLVSFPQLEYKKNSYKVNGLMEATQPFAYANQNVLNTTSGYLKELGQWKLKEVVTRTQTLLGIKPDPYDTFSWIIQNTKIAEKSIIVFFMLGDNEDISKRQNTYSLKFQQKIKFIGDYEEVAIVFSKNTVEDHELMKEEKSRMEAITHRPLRCSMFIDQSLKLPEAYRGLIQLEIEKDYSMGYSEAVGYRASTCSDFLFYDLEYELKTPLVISPIAISTQALRMHDSKSAERIVEQYQEEILNLGGELNFLFSNTDFSFTRMDNAPFWKKLFINQLKL